MPTPPKPAKTRGRPPATKGAPQPVGASAAALLKTFGENLLLARREAGLSQRALSAAAGISQRHISAIEQFGVNVSLATVAELAFHVGKTPVDLLTAPPRNPKPKS